MTDRELLEMAARAAGIDRFSFDGHDDYIVDPSYIDADGFPVVWDPLTDDGDAARLEAACKIDICWGDDCVSAQHEWPIIDVVEAFIDHGGDKQKARRYATVRAAAAIGSKHE